MPDDPLLLVPPSVGKEPGAAPHRRSDAFAKALSAERELVLEALADEIARSSRARLERLFGATGALADHAIAATGELVAGGAPLMPAWCRYTGVVWEHLDPSTLPDVDRSRLLVPSGLYGLNAGTDAIADHRLSMLVSPVGIGRLTRFWDEPVTRALRRVARGRVVVDLLPNEHAAAIDHGSLGEVAHVVRVRFLASGGTKASGHGAKAVKGRLARWILERGLTEVDAFSWEGWSAASGREGIVVVAPSGS
jgi:cytoplasmic iron level regulating protein YaaA (DUF328/UPF0246 family)